ncbi:MAG: glutamate 5-kinase [bacterium]|nr:MAG: glutamate 5-kinase [bacterium]
MNIKKRLELLGSIKRVVMKIGSGVISSPTGEELSHSAIKRLVNDICELERDGRFEVIVVSSGAVMSGAGHLGQKIAHLSIPMKQAASAVGQVSLMNLYGGFFRERKRKVAQILLTRDDVSNRRRYLNLRNTITTLMGLGITPIINENDSAAVHEIKLGDNDTLAAMVTALAGADLLLILSDVEGFYTADPATNPSAELIGEVTHINDGILEMAGESSSSSGVGGMRSKVLAARTASKYGVPTWIIGGKTEGSIPSALRHGKGGTFFHPANTKMKQRKHWIAHLLKPKGKITVDDGAKTALVEKGKSLLPSGVVSVSGGFESGDAVSLLNGGKREFARGLVNYHAFELKRIKGKKSSEIEKILGYKTYDEIIHRDDMVILEEG